MADVPVRVVVQELPLVRGDMRAIIDLATDLARRNAAIGTFWLDLDRESDLLLYLAEPQGSRLLVRRIRSSKGAEGAALEEVAIITRYAVSALLEGGQIGMQPVPAAPSPTAAPPITAVPLSDAAPAPLREPNPNTLRLGVGYSGASWSSELGWQNGVRLFTSYGFGTRWYAGVSYAWEAPLAVEATLASARILRHPAEAFFGGRFPAGFVALAAELAIGVDAQVRSTVSTAGPARTPDDTVLTVSLCPRAGFAKQVLGRTEFFGFVGVDYIVNPTGYVLYAPTREPIAGATRLRPRLDLGVSIALW